MEKVLIISPLRDTIANLRDEGVEIHVRVTWEKGDAQRYVDEARQLGVATVDCRRRRRYY